MRDRVLIAFPRDLYDSIIDFSGGQISPVALAEELVRSRFEEMRSQAANWTAEEREDAEDENFSDADAQIAAAGEAADGAPGKEPAEEEPADDAPAGLVRAEKARPGDMIWKPLAVPPGTEVRIKTGDGSYATAVVRDGKIRERKGGAGYTPNSWVSMHRDGGMGNPWWDIEMRPPNAEHFAPAKKLRRMVAMGEKGAFAPLWRDLATA